MNIEEKTGIVVEAVAEGVILQASDVTIAIGESLVRPTGSLSVKRITVPNGPWAWDLEIADENGVRQSNIVLTTVDLKRLGDLLDKAIAMEHQGSDCSSLGAEPIPTSRLPWELVPESSKMALVSKLRDSACWLFLEGFLTRAENHLISMRINEWQAKAVQAADKQSFSPVDSEPSKSEG